jgi:purine-binding chemotaxis protein CheW
MDWRTRDEQAGPAPNDDPVVGKFMAFRLGTEQYAIPVLSVREIVALSELTRVPRAEPYLLGVTNLRGRVIPVIDLGLRLGAQAAVPHGEHTVHIVVQAERGRERVVVGLVVDEVLEVLTLRASQMEPPPSLGTIESESLGVTGIARLGGRVAFLLDVDRLLSRENLTLP